MDQRQDNPLLKKPRKNRARKVDPRPFVSDAGQMPKRPVDRAVVSAGMVALALAVGFAIGVAVFALVNLSGWLTTLLWEDVGGLAGAAAGGAGFVSWFPLVACTLGGAVIGVWTWWSHDQVKSLEEVMAEFRETGSYRTNGVARPVVSFLLPLVFGGSVGFEAGLTGLITAGCCWIRDRLKAAGLRVGAVADVTIAASMAAIFGTPLAGIVAGAESSPSSLADTSSAGREQPNVDDYTLRRGVKIVLYTAAAFGAFGGIAALSGLLGTTGGLPRFDAIEAAPIELLWAVPCIALAYAMSVVYHASARWFQGVSKRLDAFGDLATIVKPALAGVVMGAVAMVLPYVLFPGESQSEELLQTWRAWGAWALVGTGLLKAAVTPMCLNMGWIGGNFFPSIFAGVAAGFGLATLTGADPMLMVTVTATAFLAGVVRKPLLVLAILFLCFPVEGVLWMGLAAMAGAALPMPSILHADDGISESIAE